jgi:hypothetical protein
METPMKRGLVVAGLGQGPTRATATPIKHVVAIFQENVSFDHYFATYPNAANPSGEPAFRAARGTVRHRAQHAGAPHEGRRLGVLPGLPAGRAARVRARLIWGERDRFLGPDLAGPHHDDVPNLDRVEAERVNQLLVDFFGT